MAMESLVKQGFINVHNGGGLSEMQEAQLNQAPLN
jgi:phage shock protein E